MMDDSMMARPLRIAFSGHVAVDFLLGVGLAAAALILAVAVVVSALVDPGVETVVFAITGLIEGALIGIIRYVPHRA